MLRNSEGENEILLGNTQLLAIFFIVAVLLGIAFYGGYMVGRASPAKSAAVLSSPATATSTAPDQTASANPPAATGGETHSVSPDGAASDTEPAPLGSPKRNSAGAPSAASATPEPVSDEAGFTPHAGQTFLQVTAVRRDEAEAITKVLDKKGFRAHAVPKPGSANLYRVIVGPIHDAGDLSSTRDSLHRTGFREVIVQRY